MRMPRGVKKQLWISVGIVFLWAVTTIIVLGRDIQRAVLGVGESDASQSSKMPDEMSWDILVVQVELRPALWQKFENSDLKEREEGYRAIIRMVDAISQDQAEHLTKQLLSRSGDTPANAHRKELYNMFERLSKKHQKIIEQLAHHATKELQKNSFATQKKDLREMMANIEREIKDTPYKFCLKGEDDEVGRCAEQLVNTRHANFLKHLRKFLGLSNSSTQRGEVLIVMARHKIPEAKEYVPALLEGGDLMELKTALRLIREFHLVEYQDTVRNLNGARYETIRSDIESTLNYLALDKGK